jgi:hypothetical protein
LRPCPPAPAQVRIALANGNLEEAAAAAAELAAIAGDVGTTALRAAVTFEELGAAPEAALARSLATGTPSRDA